jgi:membrane glycosyltransferase
MFRSKRVTRYFLLAFMIVVGLSLLWLLASSFDVETASLLRQLLAILVLLFALMAAAFFTALGIRAIQNRRERSSRRDDGEED